MPAEKKKRDTEYGRYQDNIKRFEKKLGRPLKWYDYKEERVGGRKKTGKLTKKTDEYWDMLKAEEREKKKASQGGRAGIANRKKKEGKKKEEKSEGLSGSGLYGEWLIEDEARTGVKKPRRAKRSMKDLKKGSRKKVIDHSRMTSSKKKGDKMDQWTKYYK